jgi:hypothetical protein
VLSCYVTFGNGDGRIIQIAKFLFIFFEIIAALLFHDELLYPDPKAARVCDL